MKREVKSYSLNNGVGIQCVTVTNTYTGFTWYDIVVVLLTVPWFEVLDSKYRISDTSEANRIFSEMKKKYEKLNFL